MLIVSLASEFNNFSKYPLGGEYVADCNAVWPPGYTAQSLPALYGGVIDSTA